MSIRPLLLVALLVLASPLWCQTSDESAPRSEPVVITVSAQEIPASSVSASVTILSRETIEASKAEHVLDLLQESPFVHVSQVGGAGGLATVTLRGGDPNFTLVMIDGIPVNDPTNVLGGSYDFSYLTTNLIDRIEIVRGPLSSTYGSEAISGVINIITRRGTGVPRLNLEARAGNFGAQEVRAGLEGEHFNWSYGLSGSYFDVNQTPAESTMNSKTAAAHASYDFGKQNRLNLTARITSSKTSGFPENGGGPLFSILDELENSDSTESVVGLRYQGTSFAVDFDFFQHRNDSSTPAILDQIPPGFRSLPSFENLSDFDRTRLQWTGFWKNAGWSGSLIASWKRENGDSNALIAGEFPSEFQLERDTAAAGAELLFDSENFHASAGVRLDVPENFEKEISPRVGVTWVLPNSSTRLRASWGEGFKLPSFFSLGDPNIGNPDLLPERSRAWDVGIEQEFGSRTFVSVAWFHNSFQDLIDFSPDSFRLVNRREVTTQGLEFEGRVRLHPALDLTGHVNYTDADIADTPEPLRDRPKWRGGVGFDWRISRMARVHVAYTAVGERFDFQIPVPDRSIANEYQTLDIAASYQLTKDLTAVTRIDNLLDREYQEFIGFPNPGTFFRAGLQWNVGFGKN